MASQKFAAQQDESDKKQKKSKLMGLGKGSRKKSKATLRDPSKATSPEKAKQNPEITPKKTPQAPANKDKGTAAEAHKNDRHKGKGRKPRASFWSFGSSKKLETAQ